MANQDKKRDEERVRYMSERTTEREGFLKQIRDVKDAQQIDQQSRTNLSKDLLDMKEMQNKRDVEVTELSKLQQRLLQEQTQWGQGNNTTNQSTHLLMQPKTYPLNLPCYIPSTIPLDTTEYPLP